MSQTSERLFKDFHTEAPPILLPYISPWNPTHSLALYQPIEPYPFSCLISAHGTLPILLPYISPSNPTHFLALYQPIEPSVYPFSLIQPYTFFPATFSGDWRPRMWSTIHEEGTMYSLTVCFYGAPKEFRMLFYFLLLRFKDQERDIDKLTISVEDVAVSCGTWQYYY